MEHGPISFPDWKLALPRAGLEPALQAAYAREIISFLRHCKTSHAPVTAERARQYLIDRERQTTGPAREALRWFYREGLKRTKAAVRSKDRQDDLAETARSRLVSRLTEPPPAASDLGGEPWERDLITASRERGFLWRTEQTYREWAAYRLRHAAFVP
jgi:hypothetical protein